MTASASAFSFRRIWAVLKKEFIQLKRDRATLGMIVGLPIMQLFLFGYAINSDPKHLPTVILSQDHSVFARSIVATLKASDYFQITQDIDSEEVGRRMLQEGTTTFFITLPEGFSRALIHGDRPVVLIEADASDPIAIAGPLGTVGTVIDNAIQREAIGPLGFLASDIPPYEVRIHRLYNPEGLTRYNIVPGLIGVVLTMTGVMMTALALTRERERGTMENLLSMPVKPIEVMVGKIAPYIIIGYIQASIILLTAHLVFAVPILGSLLLLGVALLMFIICNLALGFTLSAGAKNQMQAMQMSTFLLMPSILLSGFMFPFRGMPEWAQAIGSALPITYFIRIIRGLMLKDANFVEIWPNVWPMLVFMVAITAIAMRVYRKTLD